MFYPNPLPLDHAFLRLAPTLLLLHQPFISEGTRMSMFTLLSTAVAVPLALVVAVFIWFFCRAQAAEIRKKWVARKTAKTISTPQHIAVSQLVDHEIPSLTIPLSTPQFASVEPQFVPPEYQPLSFFLDNAVTTTAPQRPRYHFDLKDIPGINDSLQSELYALGYTSVEQIARWGRADVRAVSALLGVDQQQIEEEWIEGARLILSIR